MPLNTFVKFLHKLEVGMDFNPTRDLRNVQYQDPSQEPQWVADPRNMVRVEERGQLYPATMSSGIPSPRTSNIRAKQEDPFIIEQLKSRIEIAKMNCEFYEQLLQSKNDCSIQFGKKISLLDNLIVEHQKTIRETKQNAERAEKVSKAVIHLLKQADTNEGNFSSSLQSKAEIATKALSHLKGLPSTEKIDQLNQHLSQADRLIMNQFEQINSTTKTYQKKVQKLESDFVKLQQEQVLQKQQQMKLKSQESFEILPTQSNTSSPSIETKKQQTPRNQNHNSFDELDQMEQNNTEEDDIWAVFQEGDIQRNADNEEKLAVSETEKEIKKKSEGVVFLSEQEAAAIDKDRHDKKVKKETNISQFWDDLSKDNELKENSEEDDIMKPSSRSSISSQKSSSVSISFGIKSGKKKSNFSSTNKKSTSSPANKLKKQHSVNPTNVFLSFKPTASIAAKKYPPIIPGVPGNHPFPSTSHECLRVVSKYVTNFSDFYLNFLL